MPLKNPYSTIYSIYNCSFILSAIAVALGVLQLLITGISSKFPFTLDTSKLSCDDTLSRGVWTDSNTYLPTTCSLKPYSPKDTLSCLSNAQNTTLLFIGDSRIRNLFEATKIFLGYARKSEYMASNTPGDVFDSKANLNLRFIFDPFINQTNYNIDSNSKTYAIVSSGLWFMKYLQPDISYSQFTNSTEAILDRLNGSRVFFKLISPVNEQQLSPSRAATLKMKTITRYNRFLRDLSIRTNLDEYPLVPESLNSIYEEPPPDSYTDGLHYKYNIVINEIKIFLNLICNKKMYQNVKGTTSCCVEGPQPSFKNLLFVGSLLAFSIFSYILRLSFGDRKLYILEYFIPPKKLAQSLLFLVLYLGYMLLTDRTTVFIKISKVFHWTPFLILMFLTLFIGLYTMKNTGDSSFLNRYQTDEWKGWMQLFILVYHYVGASKVSVIYNFIRVLVASYIFMTGYGHFSFFYKKNDFGLKRVSKVLLRLNILTIIMSYTMDQPILFYYFAPLVSFWFLVIYFTMFIGGNNNDDRVLFIKIGISIAITWMFINLPFIIPYFFNGLEILFGAKNWDIKEAQFRLGLDEWMIYVGMIVSWAAIHTVKFSNASITSATSVKSYLFSIPVRDVQLWETIKLCAFVFSWSAIGMFFFIDFRVESKFAYNDLHPIISLLPVISFVILRNANEFIRKYNSEFWMWIGKCSLETFLLQYHFWLALDTRGLVILLPLSGVASYSLEYWINFILATVLFLGISEHVSKISSEIVEWTSMMGMIKMIIILIIFNHVV